MFEARLKEANGSLSRLSRLDSSQNVALEQMESRLQEEVSRAISEHRRGHSQLRDLISDMRNETDAQFSRVSGAHRTVFEDTDAKVDDLVRKYQKLEAAHRSSIQTLELEIKELSDEISRSGQYKLTVAQRATLDDLDGSL